MSTDPQHPFGLNDDDVVPFQARRSEGAATFGDTDAVAFERRRSPGEDRRSAGLSSEMPVAGESPWDLTRESGAAQATPTPAPTPSSRARYEPPTASGRAAKRRLEHVDGMHAETGAPSAWGFEDDTDSDGSRIASRASLVATAAICAALMLLLVAVLHRGTGGRAATMLGPPAERLEAAVPTSGLSDVQAQPHHHRRMRRAGAAGTGGRARVRTRTVVVVERLPATNAMTEASAPVAVPAPTFAPAVVEAPACVPGDLGC